MEADRLLPWGETLPLYEYRCTQCGHRYEKIQKFSDAPDAACPQCGGQVERPLSAPALQFKGAGWYINDHAPKAASGSASKTAESSGGESKPAESKPAESKPAAESSAPAPAPSSTTSTSGNS